MKLRKPCKKIKKLRRRSKKLKRTRRVKQRKFGLGPAILQNLLG